MALPEQNLYTIKDIYELPDGKRAELINGQIYYMAPPGRIHQLIVGKLYQEIANYIDSHKGNCEVYPAPFAVFLNKDDKTYVEPDISLICDKDKLDDKGCQGAPDWVIEIVSPSSRRMDYDTKLFKYWISGIREYWIVDPLKKRIMVWHFEQNPEHSELEVMEMYTFNDTVKAGIYEDLYIDFSKISL